MESSDDFSKIFYKILFYFFQKSLRIPSHVFKKSPSRCTRNSSTSILNEQRFHGKRRIVSFHRENFFVDFTIHGGFREKFETGRTALYRLIAFPCVETSSRGMCKGLMERIEGQRAESLALAKKSRCWKVNEGGIK